MTRKAPAPPFPDAGAAVLWAFGAAFNPPGSKPPRAPRNATPALIVGAVLSALPDPGLAVVVRQGFPGTLHPRRSPEERATWQALMARVAPRLADHGLIPRPDGA